MITHTPGPMPVDPDTIVIVVLEDDTVLSAMPASEINWNLPGDDVIAYRVVGE